LQSHQPSTAFTCSEILFHGSEADRCGRQADQSRNFDKDFASVQKIGMPVFQIGISEDAVQKQQRSTRKKGSFIGADGGLYRSANGGDTLTKLTGGGRPDDSLQVQLTISPTLRQPEQYQNHRAGQRPDLELS
jgi:hypothetical protein